MTSLTETLPILDEAVPALPGKVEAVARKSEEFHGEAQQARELFRGRRAEAQALVEQVRQVLDAVREHAVDEQQRLDGLGRGLGQAVEEEARGVGEAADALHDAGEEAGDAFESLESSLVQAGDRIESAHDEARGAMEALAAEAKSSEPELEGAAAAMVAAVGATRLAIEGGSAQVAQAVTALKDSMLRLLSDAEERLGQTYQKLDELRAGQETAVQEATSELDGEMRRVEQELERRVEAEVRQALDPGLDDAERVLTDMGQQVGKLHSDVDTASEELAEQLTEVGERIPPLQGGVQQVKEAAAQLGIPW